MSRPETPRPGQAPWRFLSVASLLIALAPGLLGAGSPRDFGLALAQDLLDKGDTEKALREASRLLAQKANDIEATLAILDFMSRVYQKEGNADKELACYEQIASYESWHRLVPPERHARLYDRTGAIVGKVDRSEGLAPVEVIGLSTRLLAIIKPLLFDPGLAANHTMRMLATRGRARAALGEPEQARGDLLDAIASPAAEWLFDARFDAAKAVVTLAQDAQARAAARLELMQLSLDTHDPDVAFLCQAALAEAAISAKEWKLARNHLRAAFCICRQGDAPLAVLRRLAAAIAAQGADAGLREDAIAALSAYGESGPAGRDGKLYTEDDAVFPVEALRDEWAPAEAQLLRDKITGIPPAGDALRHRARLNLILGDCDAAFADTYAAYHSAPRGFSAQMEALRDFVAALRSRTGRSVNPAPFYSFAAFGPAGRDGEPGTTDDLADPFAPLLVKP